MQNTDKHLRQSIERYDGEREDGGKNNANEEKEARICSLDRKRYAIPELTDAELGQVEKGYDQFAKRHDVAGDESIIRMRYFVRIAYLFGFINGKRGKDPSYSQ